MNKFDKTYRRIIAEMKNDSQINESLWDSVKDIFKSKKTEEKEEVEKKAKEEELFRKNAENAKDGDWEGDDEEANHPWNDAHDTGRKISKEYKANNKMTSES